MLTTIVAFVIFVIIIAIIPVTILIVTYMLNNFLLFMGVDDTYADLVSDLRFVLVLAWTIGCLLIVLYGGCV